MHFSGWPKACRFLQMKNPLSLLATTKFSARLKNMDWTMINNAKDQKHRVQTLYYLLHSRAQNTIMDTPLLYSQFNASSLCEISLLWLLATAAGVMLFSLLEAGLATLIVYGKVAFLKKIFPVPHNLIRSHVDYLIMTTLLCVTYFTCLHLAIELPKWNHTYT